MLPKIYVLLLVKTFQSLQVVAENTTVATKSSRLVAKIQYGKHYVTRTFSTVPSIEALESISPSKRRIRVRRIRKTSEAFPATNTSFTPSSIADPDLDASTKLTSRKPKYTTNWWRYTTNYRGASPPYPLNYFPEVLAVRHNITKWWDPRYTEWFNLFTGRTAESKWLVYTIRMYPFKELSTVFKPALPGILNKMMRNYGVTEAITNPPNWMERKYWEMLPPLSEGPPRAYRPVYWYQQRNLSCPHPVVTNTATPYTGPPLIEFFDCDNFQHNYHYGYDDSELYSEEARLVEKFGSKDESEASLSDENMPQRMRGKIYNPDQDDDSLTVENLANLKNLSRQKLEEHRRRVTTPPSLLLTKPSKRTRRKSTALQNTTLSEEYEGGGGGDARDTEEFEYMMGEYMNMDEREDLQARKQRRRMIRTMCGQIISTIKKKLNTIWWKTFWKQTATTPSRKKYGQSTPWFRLINTLVGDSLYPENGENVMIEL